MLITVPTFVRTQFLNSLTNHFDQKLDSTQTLVHDLPKLHLHCRTFQHVAFTQSVEQHITLKVHSYNLHLLGTPLNPTRYIFLLLYLNLRLFHRGWREKEQHYLSYCSLDFSLFVPLLPFEILSFRRQSEDSSEPLHDHSTVDPELPVWPFWMIADLVSQLMNPE